MMAHGGPESLDEVEPYLAGIIGRGRLTREAVERARERYAAIGGRSPLNEITFAQAAALEGRLGGARVYVGMRHWKPGIAEAVARAAGDGVERLVALCMTPQYSRASVGAYFGRLRGALEERGVAPDLALVKSYHDNPLFIRAVARKVVSALERFPARQVIFTAHSLPEALVEQGDPYDGQVRETASLVAGAAGLEDGRWRLCYQSAAPGSGGRAKWLGPALRDVIAELAGSGQGGMLVVPVGFVADHVEVLYDVDVEARGLAEERGARLERADSLNASPAFVDALADVVKGAAERWR